MANLDIFAANLNNAIMKKNVITAIIAGIVLIALCVGGYFLHEKNEAERIEHQRTIEKIKNVGKISDQNSGFKNSDLPDGSPLKVGTAEYSVESENNKSD